MGKTFGLSLIDSFKIVLFISSPKIFPAGLLRKSGEEFIRTLQRFDLAEILLCMWQGFEIYTNMDKVLTSQSLVRALQFLRVSVLGELHARF